MAEALVELKEVGARKVMDSISRVTKSVEGIARAEKIYQNAIARRGEISEATDRKILARSVQQAKTINSARVQVAALGDRLLKLGASAGTLQNLNTAFRKLSFVLKSNTISASAAQKTVDKYKASLAGARREAIKLADAQKRSAKAQNAMVAGFVKQNNAIKGRTAAINKTMTAQNGMVASTNKLTASTKDGKS